MTLFLLLMLPCTIAILCAARAVDGRAGFALGLVMLTLQGLCIVSYANYVTIRDTPSLADRMIYDCEAVDITHMGDDNLALHFSVGFKGDYRDGNDNTIYSPGCNIPDAPWLNK